MSDTPRSLLPPHVPESAARRRLWSFQTCQAGVGGGLGAAAAEVLLTSLVEAPRRLRAMMGLGGRRNAGRRTDADCRTRHGGSASRPALASSTPTNGGGATGTGSPIGSSLRRSHAPTRFDTLGRPRPRPEVGIPPRGWLARLVGCGWPPGTTACHRSLPGAHSRVVRVLAASAADAGDGPKGIRR